MGNGNQRSDTVKSVDGWSDPSSKLIPSLATSLHTAEKSALEDHPAKRPSEKTAIPDAILENSSALPPVLEAEPLYPEEHADDREPIGAGQFPTADSNQKILWVEAYERLRRADPKLVDAYESDLLRYGSQLTPKVSPQIPAARTRMEELQGLVKDRLNALQDAQLKITVGKVEIVVRDQVRKVVRTILTFKDFIGAAISAEPHASLAWAGVLVVLPLLSNPITQFDDAIDGVEYISNLLVRCGVMVVTYNLSHPGASQRMPSTEVRNLYEQLRTNTIDLYSQILKYQLHIARQYSRAGFFRFLRDFVALDEWKDMIGTLEKTEDNIRKDLRELDSGTLDTIALNVSNLQGKADDILIKLKEVRREVESSMHRQQLATLTRAKYAAFDTFPKDAPPPSRCYEGTRTEILDEIQRWGDGKGDNCVFWVSGMAGTGKSTIARTVAERFHRQNRLGASFFFPRAQGGLCAEATALLTTLAVQLTKTLPDITPHTCRAIADRSNIGELSLSDQWDNLVLQPLSILGGSMLIPLVLVIVVDALDECKGADYIPEILRLLTNANNLGMIRLRIFITSRRESYIHSSFEQIPGILHRDLVLDSILDGRTERDISIVLRYAMGEVAKAHSLKDWPSEEDIQALVRKAGRLFIYAATVSRYLRSSKFLKKRLLEMLAGSAAGHSSTKELDNIYMQILLQPFTDCCDEDRGDLFELFKRIVGSIAILLEALSPLALSELLDITPDDIATTINPLSSVLTIPNGDIYPIEIFHLSFPDFLLDKERCTDPQLWVDGPSAHRYLFERCLDLMSDHLRKDVCGLRRPGVLASEVEKCKVENCLRPAVQYACCHWATHLHGARVSLHDGDRLHTFLRDHFLHWLEALSLMGKTSLAVHMITSLESANMIKHGTDLLAFIQDAKRFILHNRPIMEEVALQIYSSALIFTPELSIIRRQFADEIPPWFSRLPTVPRDWSPLEQTLLGHSESIKCISSSPDGSKFASGSWDCSVRVWNSVTGEAERILEGHSKIVISVSFSADGTKLLSASLDGTVRVWNVYTGQARQIPVDPESVDSVAFSADGSKLASEFKDYKILITSTTTGQVEQTFEGHSAPIASIGFSPDGRKLASGCRNHTVRIWETATGKVEQTYSTASVESVAFSPDGSKLVSASPGTVQLWDSSTGQVERSFTYPFDRIDGVTFSPDRRKFAVAFRDNSIRVWNISTGQVDWTLEGHSDFVRAIDFSPDGTKLVSGSQDNTVRIWNIARRAGQIPKGHAGSVLSIAFSPDGNKLASGSRDGILRVWNATTGQVEQTLEGSHTWCHSVTFSPDGSKLASAADNVSVWNISTGRVEKIFGSNLGVIDIVTFSPDGNKLASASQDNVVRIWDVSTGRIEQELEGHLERVKAITFSADGSKLASGSRDHTIRVWDTATGQVEQTLLGCSGVVHRVAFSPDGIKLGSVSQDSAMRIWNTATWKVEQTIKDHLYPVTAISFSPDNKRLASGCLDCTVRVWNTHTRQAEWILDGHSDHITSIAFSTDGKKLVSGFKNGTTRVWSMDTGQAEQTPEINSANNDSNSANGPLVSPDGNKLLFWPNNGMIRICNIFTGQVEQEGLVNPHEVAGFSPDSSKLAFSSDSLGSNVEILDIATGQIKQTLKGHTNRVESIAFSPDDSKLASTSGDRTVRLWNTATGQLEQILRGHLYWVNGVSFSLDGSRLVSASSDGVVRVWNAATGQAERTLEGYVPISFSADGNLALGSRESTTRVWDTITGQIEQTLDGCSDLATGKAFSPDGSKSYAFYSADGAWLTRNGSRLLYLPLDYRPGSIATKGNTLAIGTLYGLVTIIVFRQDVEAETV